MSSFWAHLNVKLENCQTLRALIKRWNIQITHLAVKAAQNHHWQLHLLLAPRLRASGSPQRRGMFPVQHAQRENAFSKHRSRTLMPTCLLQLQFLCAQHHLECGHWQTRTCDQDSPAGWLRFLQQTHYSKSPEMRVLTRVQQAGYQAQLKRENAPAAATRSRSPHQPSY